MPVSISTFYRGVHPQTLRGLFNGKSIMHGFKCADKGKRPKTRRDWQPNVQYKFLYSEALQRKLRLFVTANTLKHIDIAGGLDMYLLTNRSAASSSIVGEQLRNLILQEYEQAGRKLPVKEGITSILDIVDEKLKAAGLSRSTLARSPAAERSSGDEASASQPPGMQSAADSATASAGDGPGAAAQRPQGTSGGDAGPARWWWAQKRRTRQLTSGRRVRQELVEARKVAERLLERKARRREGFLTTMRRTAENKALRIQAQMRALEMKAAAQRQSTSSEARERTATVESALPPDLKQRFSPTVDVPCIRVGDVYVPALERRRHDAVTGSPEPDWKHRYDYVDDRALKRNILRPRHAAGKKWNRLAKWLDSDKWRPHTDGAKLVLPNGMTLWSDRRRGKRATAARGREAARPTLL